MGTLTVVFTAATRTTTWRLHRVLESSFKLRFDNQVLIESLQTAKDQAEALNRSWNSGFVTAQPNSWKPTNVRYMTCSSRQALTQLRFTSALAESGAAPNSVM
jgi:hypothetical protein